jgi:hypothetical protein
VARRVSVEERLNKKSLRKILPSWRHGGKTRSDENNFPVQNFLDHIAIKQDLFNRNLVGFRQHAQGKRGANRGGRRARKKSCALCREGNLRCSGYSFYP